MKNDWLKVVPENIVGKDFIVGDLHGNYDLLIDGLTKVNFDFSNDRLFCVGDLVDKGTQSVECLELLNKDWFYSVAGNHEVKLLNEINKRFGFLGKISNIIFGDNFLESRKDLEQYKKFEKDLTALPVMIKVENSQCPFFIAHAGRPYKKKNHVLKVWNDKKIKDRSELKLTDKWFLKILWKRKLAKEALSLLSVGKGEIESSPDGLSFNIGEIKGKDSFKKKVSVTYAGHTISPKVLVHKSHIFIDGGSHKGGVLRIIDHSDTILEMKKFAKKGGKVPKSFKG